MIPIKANLNNIARLDVEGENELRMLGSFPSEKSAEAYALKYMKKHNIKKAGLDLIQFGLEGKINSEWGVKKAGQQENSGGALNEKKV